jgi:hypothetical protein
MVVEGRALSSMIRRNPRGQLRPTHLLYLSRNAKYEIFDAPRGRFGRSLQKQLWARNVDDGNPRHSVCDQV